MHDSFRLENQTPTEWLDEHADGDNVLDDICSFWDELVFWRPFLTSGQNWTKRLVQMVMT